MPNPFEPNQHQTAHQNADTDMSFDALHHTLGVGETQAAKGTHQHTATTAFITPLAGWVNVNGSQGLEINKHSGLVTTHFYIQRTSSIAMTAGVLYYYGTLPVGFRPVNFDNVGAAVAKLGDVRTGAVGIFATDGMCGIRVFTSGTIAPIGTYAPDDYIAVNATFRHA